MVHDLINTIVDDSISKLIVRDDSNGTSQTSSKNLMKCEKKYEEGEEDTSRGERVGERIWGERNGGHGEE
uniref:Uncharacterized protein n=1 Tax=Vespula pensylvanica TaxID=30213 RepID=A0A834UG92_VESPE|nr:hypothetical protein H0235_000621 [Vespula pensylvanica]